MELALHGATTFEGDLLGHELAEPIDDGALHLGLRAGRIDDLPPDIYRRPDLIDVHSLCRVDADLRHLSDVSTVVKLKGETHRGTIRQTTRVPSCPALVASSTTVVSP